MKEYDKLLEEVRTKILPLNQTIRTTAKEYIPKMYQALCQEDINLTPQDARERIEKDCIELWSKRTILDALPDEAKNATKQLSGKQRKRKSAAMIAATTNGNKVLIDYEKVSDNSHNSDYTKQNQDNLTFSRNYNNQLIKHDKDYIKELEETVRNQQQFQFQFANEIVSEDTLFYFPKEKFQQLKEHIEKSKEGCYLKFDKNKTLKEILPHNDTVKL